MWRIWAAALFWGLNWPIIKVLIAHASPWALRAAGLSAGALVLAATTRLAGKSLAIPRVHWPAVLIGGLLNVAAFNVLSVFAQMSLSASRAAIITYTMPLWSVLFARLALGEPIDRLRSLGLALGAAGIAFLAAPFWGPITEGNVPPGLLYVLASAIAWAAGTVFLKWARPEGDPLALTTWQIAVGAVAALTGMLLFEVPRLDLATPWLASVFAFHVVFPQAAAYALWFTLMAQVSASTAALGTLLVPVFAVAASSYWLGERLETLDWLGFAMILSAVALDQGLRPLLAQKAASRVP